MPSNSVLEQKKAVVADLVEKIKKAQSGVLVQYQGITVENDTKMRAAFRKAGIDYMVIKNTLMRFAVKEAGLEDAEQIHGIYVYKCSGTSRENAVFINIRQKSGH